MTDVSITPEDREKLAKSKFKEWADEWFKDVGPAAFAAWLEEARKQQPQPGQSTPSQPQQPGDPQPPQPAQRRRSLLDIALSDTFGF